MLFEESLFAFLSAQPMVISIFADRIYPVSIPQGAEQAGPVFVYRRSGTASQDLLAAAGFTVIRMEFVFYGKMYLLLKTAAEVLRKQVLTPLENLDSPQMVGLNWINETDTWEPTLQIYGVFSEYEFTIAET